MGKFLKQFSELSKNDTSIAGGKGASLGEMTQEGMPVPSGFVILADAFEQFLADTDLNVEVDTIFHTVDIKKIHTVENASEKIQSLILAAKFPINLKSEITAAYSKLGASFVAVRSSATAEDSVSAAWAGQLDSFLNTSKNNLLKNIQKCWASLFTLRAIFYRFEKKLSKTKISVAVIIQKMVQSEISGICFTVHPITKNYDQMVIEAGYGLGEIIVGGKITPDAYVVYKKNGLILDKNIGQQKIMSVKNKGGNIEKLVSKLKQKKQKLSDIQVSKLFKICREIEKHYKMPQDIEWAFLKGKFYILQARPITTLSHL